jgi:hypothetical protein
MKSGEGAFIIIRIARGGERAAEERSPNQLKRDFRTCHAEGAVFTLTVSRES